ncbi:uncharacterized protein [Lolium perenne]|uniref:uncharacterized protein isoform X1 n=1 Tax=Lolium perenne TaxID=4522 RepID=UPI0021F5F7C2|nr:uncharacterized protein LOC127301998 isoform X5 [Lolium perenne]
MGNALIAVPLLKIQRQDDPSTAGRRPLQPTARDSASYQPSSIRQGNKPISGSGLHHQLGRDGKRHTIYTGGHKFYIYVTRGIFKKSHQGIRKKVCVCSIFSSKGVLDLMPGLDKLAGSFLMELYSLHSPGGMGAAGSSSGLNIVSTSSFSRQMGYSSCTDSLPCPRAQLKCKDVQRCNLDNIV